LLKVAALIEHNDQIDIEQLEESLITHSPEKPVGRSLAVS
jgi:hypothetical protein